MQGSVPTSADVPSPESLHSASFQSAVSSVALDMDQTGSTVQHNNDADISSKSTALDSARPAALDSACPAAVVPSERQTAVPESSRSVLAPVQHEAANTCGGQQHNAALEVQACSSTASHPEPGLQLGLENIDAAVTDQEILEDPEVMHCMVAGCAGMYRTFTSKVITSLPACSVAASHT